MSRHLVSRLYVGADNETGELQLTTIATVVSRKFQGFTVVEGMGYWEGRPEKCAVITIAQAELDPTWNGGSRKRVDRYLEANARELGRKLAARCEQECVMVESQWCDVEFVDGSTIGSEGE
jgi:hypothetical protein